MEARDGESVVRKEEGDLAELLRARTGVQLRAGHHVSLVENGTVFDAMEALCAQAREHIHLLMYIWRPGRASDRVVRMLSERARAGVRCRVVVDAVGSRGGFHGEVLPRLERAGCEARIFHVPGRVSLRRLPVRLHRKLLSVDGRLGLTGGWCIADEWLGDGRSVDAWRDTAVSFCGPAVSTLEAVFARDWSKAGGGALPLPGAPEVGPARAAFVADTGAARSTMRAMVEEIIGSARHRLWLASGYFVPGRRLIRRLAERAKAGVDVRVLVPGHHNDVPIARVAQRSRYGPLLRAGVRLWEYQPGMMHAKTAVVDGRFAVVGSTNLDPGALELLEEGSLVVEEPAFNAALADAFAADLRFSREVTRRRPLDASFSPMVRAVWALLTHTHALRQPR